jgi:glycosyltransferase involved in cell wall biosynthesis
MIEKRSKRIDKPAVNFSVLLKLSATKNINLRLVASMPKKKIWIVIPCYYDSQSIQKVIATSKFSPSHEIHWVIIDDSAGVDAEIKQIQQSNITILETSRNTGHQGAIILGLRWLSEIIEWDDIVITMDGDGEDRPLDLVLLIETLLKEKTHSQSVVLAKRAQRKESLFFKILYFHFKLFFLFLTGRIIRTGNFACYYGDFLKRNIQNPKFDLSYSATFYNLPIKLQLVVCPKGERFFGRSKMTTLNLVQHGISMLLPFLDIISIRLMVITLVTSLSTALLTLTSFYFTQRPIFILTFLLVLIFSFVSFLQCFILNALNAFKMRPPSELNRPMLYSSLKMVKEGP